MYRTRNFGIAVVALILTHAAFADDDPYADEVIDYEAGTNESKGYTDENTTLGPPERFTGEGVFPSVVSVFNPPFGTDEIVSIGANGFLIVRFNKAVTDDPNNLYGIDLIIFANTGFIDSDWPNGVVGGVFGNEGGTVEVSADGTNWFTVPGAAADSLMPTVGYLDSGPYDQKSGSVLSNFTQPVDPSLTLSHFTGLNNSQVLEMYRGAGGGVGIDIASVGLSQITHVRVSNPSGASEALEIDAFADAAPQIVGDVNLNGTVNVDDLLQLISAWGLVHPGGAPADFNNDDLVNVNDLLLLIGNWGATS